MAKKKKQEKKKFFGVRTTIKEHTNAPVTGSTSRKPFTTTQNNDSYKRHPRIDIYINVFENEEDAKKYIEEQKPFAS